MSVSRVLWAQDQKAGGPVEKLALMPEPELWDVCLRLAARGLLTLPGGDRIGLGDGATD